MNRREWKPAWQLEVNYAGPQDRMDMPPDIMVSRWERNDLGERRLVEAWIYKKERPASKDELGE